MTFRSLMLSLGAVLLISTSAPTFALDQYPACPKGKSWQLDQIKEYERQKQAKSGISSRVMQYPVKIGGTVIGTVDIKITETSTVGPSESKYYLDDVLESGEVVGCGGHVTYSVSRQAKYSIVGSSFNEQQLDESHHTIRIKYNKPIPTPPEKEPKVYEAKLVQPGGETLEEWDALGYGTK